LIFSWIKYCEGSGRFEPRCRPGFVAGGVELRGGTEVVVGPDPVTGGLLLTPRRPGPSAPVSPRPRRGGPGPGPLAPIPAPRNPRVPTGGPVSPARGSPRPPQGPITPGGPVRFPPRPRPSTGGPVSPLVPGRPTTPGGPISPRQPFRPGPTTPGPFLQQGPGRPATAGGPVGPTMPGRPGPTTGGPVTPSGDPWARPTDPGSSLTVALGYGRGFVAPAGTVLGVAAARQQEAALTMVTTPDRPTSSGVSPIGVARPGTPFVVGLVGSDRPAGNTVAQWFARFASAFSVSQTGGK